MTREEALKILKTRDAHGVPTGYAGGIVEAIDMAVEALENQPFIPHHKLHQAVYTISNEKGSFDLVVVSLSDDAPEGYRFDMAEIVDYFKEERTIIRFNDKRFARAVIQAITWGLKNFKLPERRRDNGGND